jgi:RNA polymerase sigma factor (sigma-70 family)
MASGTKGGTWRHLRDLFRHGTAVGLDDGQLLARYTDNRDESAFETLVARHGPMVLATCRAVLQHEHDVEDAFQATFLVLARKAGSVHAGDALGGWLHRVAYRAAVQASVEEKRRRLHEVKAATATLQATHTETEIPSIIHEELDRLPDRQRLPVVLCDLEGLTYEQAARHLQWSEPTLRHRLVKARQRLRDRLIRRGLTAGTVGIASAGLSSRARSLVPAALARSVIDGASSPTATVLSNVIIRSMFMTKLKLASAGILAAIAMASGGVFAVGPQTTDKPEGAMKAPDVVKETPAATPIQKRSVEAKVVAQDGPTLPIEGRVVDLEGRPVAGAKVELLQLWATPDKNLNRWLDQAKDRGLNHPSEGLSEVNLTTAQPAAPILPQSSPTSPTNPHVVTGPDGRFRLNGIGHAQIAKIRVSGPTISLDHLYVMGREGTDIRVKVRQPLSPEVIFHPRKLEAVVSPTKPIEGVIRDQETGKPIAGVTLRGAHEVNSLVTAHGIEAKTDEKGFYRLIGFPKASAYRIFVEPGTGKPYPNASFRAEGKTPAFDPVIFDITLKRGILVRGKVTDKATGQPVPGYVQVFVFYDNPYIREFPGFRAGLPRYCPLDNGRYEIVALPGRSVIGFRSDDMHRYRGYVGAESIKGYDPKFRGFNTSPYMTHAGNYNTMAELNLDPKAESATLDLQADPGRTITVKVVDPGGKPVADTIAYGVGELFSSTTYPQSSSEIQVFALDPSHPRRVTVTHASRKLIGSVYLKGDEPSPLTLWLQPSGTIMGRVVDEDGKPRGGITIGSIDGSNPKHPDVEGIFPGGDFGGGIPLGHDGRFRIEGLVPGLKYGGNAIDGNRLQGNLFHDVTVAPGEVKDLGDIKAIPPKPNAADVAKETPPAKPIQKRGAAPKPQPHDGPILPIEGRVVDLEGRPIAGARIELFDCWQAPNNDLDKWLAQAKDRGLGIILEEGLQRVSLDSQPTLPPSFQGPPSPPRSPSTTTGTDGRFQLIGISPAQLAKIRITGPTIARDYRYVMGREGAEVRVTLRHRPSPNEIIFHPRKLDIAATPTKPIEGFVRDKDTGKPLAGITLKAAVYVENDLYPDHDISATTDDRGFYRLIGFPKASAYRVFVDSAPGQPYPRVGFRAVANTRAFDPVSFDIALKRGVLVRGKVTDKETGKPLQKGYVEAFAFADNPHIDEFPGFRLQSKAIQIFLDHDGRFEVIALPGRNLIGVRVNTRYRLAVGAESIKGFDPKRQSFKTTPYSGYALNYNTLAEIDLAPKVESANLDLRVDPGRTITVKAVDPDGKPVANTMASGITDLSTAAHPQPSNEIQVFALDPSHPRRVTITHANRKLIGSIYLKGNEAGPLTIRLQPSGTIVGRIVDEGGKPRGGISIGSIHGSFPKRPAEQGILPGGDWNLGIPLGQDGRFRIEGLVPGLQYGGDARKRGMYLGEIFRDVILKPGEVKDLGDLKAILPKPTN